MNSGQVPTYLHDGVTLTGDADLSYMDSAYLTSLSAARAAASQSAFQFDLHKYCVINYNFM